LRGMTVWYKDVDISLSLRCLLSKLLRSPPMESLGRAHPSDAIIFDFF
jgi:hypothetical protein